MKKLIELTDHDLINQIENLTFPADQFSHLIQLRISWILIREFGLNKALLKNRDITEQFYQKVLKHQKYNANLTTAYTEILHHFREKSSSNNFEKLLNEFPRLKYNFKDLVKTHYGYNILKGNKKSDISNRPILFTF